MVVGRVRDGTRNTGWGLERKGGSKEGSVRKIEKGGKGESKREERAVRERANTDLSTGHPKMLHLFYSSPRRQTLSLYRHNL